MAYIPLEKQTEALADFSKAIELAPNSVRGYIGRAQILLAQKQYDQTLADLDKAISLNPKEPPPIVCAALPISNAPTGPRP